MKSPIGSFFVALGVTIISTAAYAHGPRGACRQDLQALCPDVTPGPGAFRTCLEALCPGNVPGPDGFDACLQQYSNQLSTACQNELTQMQTERAAWQQACGADVESKCSAAGDRREVFRCMHDNHDQLSQACQDFLATHHRPHHHCDHPSPEAGA